MDVSLDLIPDRLHLVIAPRSTGYQLLNTCIARLALAGPVDVLDGGNGFDVHTIACQLRAHSSDTEAALQRIQIARAFTCYQVVALLAEHTPAPHPLLVMDLLATFADENVPQLERLRLLDQVIERLLFLSHLGAVAVSVSPLVDEKSLARLEAAMKPGDGGRLAIWRYEAPIERLPLRLF